MYPKNLQCTIKEDYYNLRTLLQLKNIISIKISKTLLRYTENFMWISNFNYNFKKYAKRISIFKQVNQIFLIPLTSNNNIIWFIIFPKYIKNFRQFLNTDFYFYYSPKKVH